MCPAVRRCVPFFGARESLPHQGLSRQIWADFDSSAEDEKKAGRKSRGRKRPLLGHNCPQCGQFQRLQGGVVKGKISVSRGRDSLYP